jgi:hypothetical protein
MSEDEQTDDEREAQAAVISKALAHFLDENERSGGATEPVTEAAAATYLEASRRITACMEPGGMRCIMEIETGTDDADYSIVIEDETVRMSISRVPVAMAALDDREKVVAAIYLGCEAYIDALIEMDEIDEDEVDVREMAIEAAMHEPADLSRLWN